MRSTSVRRFALATALALAACVGPRPPQPDSEVARIRAHLAGAIDELRSNVRDGLTSTQAEARAQAIEWLEEYRDSGVFPHNHVRAGQRVPVFVDPHGTPCAVGYLMLRSGEEGLVEDIVRHANLARVPELAGDARLQAWLERRGLTLAEAARIQPMYGPLPPPEPPPVPSSYAGETVGLSIVAAAVAAYTRLSEPDPGGFEWAGWANVAASVGHVALLAAAGSGGAPSWQLGVNAVGAFLGATTAEHRFDRRRDAIAQERRVAVLPYVGEDDGRVKVGLTLRH